MGEAMIPTYLMRSILVIRVINIFGMSCRVILNIVIRKTNKLFNFLKVKFINDI